MKAPDGTPIVATLETIPGSCGVFLNDDGAWEYDGNGTYVCWDAQETEEYAGQPVFLDEDNKEWLESQLIPDDADPQPHPQPWYRDYQLRQKEIENTIEALFARITGGKKIECRDVPELREAVRNIMGAYNYHGRDK